MSKETRNFYDELQQRSQASEDIARQTLEFFANDGHITVVPNFLGTLVDGLLASEAAQYKEKGKRGSEIGNKMRVANLKMQSEEKAIK